VFCSATTHTILKSNNIFLSCLAMRKVNINIIYGITNIFEASKRVSVLLSRTLLKLIMF